jgi:HlyD family secretion protein
MKTIFSTILYVVGLFLLIGCSIQEEKSDAYGNFEAREIIVSAQMQGELLSLDLEEGQTLEQGTTVGWIDTSLLAVKREQLLARRNSLGARLANIRAQEGVQAEQIETLQTEKNRVQRLLKDEAATPQKFDNIQGQLRVAEKKLQSIRTQRQSVYAERQVLNTRLNEVHTQIEKCRITNPIRGTVLEKYLEPSEVAAPGKAIYKIADLSEMILRVYISGAQLPHIQVGQEVEVLIDENREENQSLSGRVSWISSKAEFTPKIIQTKEERVDLVYAVKVRVKNDGSIKIGMPGEINF